VSEREREEAVPARTRRTLPAGLGWGTSPSGRFDVRQHTDAAEGAGREFEEKETAERQGPSSLPTSGSLGIQEPSPSYIK